MRIRPTSPRETTREGGDAAMWYVIQVLKGREQAMAELIGRVAPRGLIEECFSPRYATEAKIRGAWQPCERDLFPGYLIAVTDSPAEVAQVLYQLPEFARVVKQGGVYEPLSQVDVDLIAGFTERGQRVVPISRAVKDGDRVIVTEGPLVGNEALITKIDRKRSVAYVQLDLCGLKVRARLGLAVLSDPAAMPARRAALYKREALAAIK